MTDAPRTFFHGTKADLAAGDLIEAGRVSNYGSRKPAQFVYLTETLDAATWGAELAVGEGRGRIYVVEPTGAFEDDPNLTNKRFPGNPTKSYRTREPLRVIPGSPPEDASERSGSADRRRRCASASACSRRASVLPITLPWR